MPQMMQIAGIDYEKPGQTYDQTLALRPDMALASGSNTSVALTAADLQMQTKQMEQRRHDRQRHHHSQIWTKDFHGGPYRKASGLHLPHSRLCRPRFGASHVQPDQTEVHGRQILTTGAYNRRQTARRATTRCCSILMGVTRRWCLDTSARTWVRLPTSWATT